LEPPAPFDVLFPDRALVLFGSAVALPGADVVLQRLQGFLGARGVFIFALSPAGSASHHLKGSDEPDDPRPNPQTLHEFPPWARSSRPCYYGSSNRNNDVFAFAVTR